MKRLSPPRVTIIIPTKLLEAVKEKSKKSRSDLSTWTSFALLKSLQDENFSWDLQQSRDFLDQQLEL